MDDRVVQLLTIARPITELRELYTARYGAVTIKDMRDVLGRLLAAGRIERRPSDSRARGREPYVYQETDAAWGGRRLY
jgi:hypothetical protein